MTGVVTLLLLAAAVDVAIRCGAIGGLDGVIESGGSYGRCRFVGLVKTNSYIHQNAVI